jgi:hypothetical protein
MYIDKLDFCCESISTAWASGSLYLDNYNSGKQTTPSCDRLQAAESDKQICQTVDKFGERNGPKWRAT